jgi:hypothetical protein
MLNTTITNPLEREYEGWIARGIEDHFATLGTGVHVVVISPRDESNWPADLAFDFATGKVLGLQLKRPYVHGGVKSFDRLFWGFDDPRDQMQNVKDHPEIFYCLPTFIDREYRRVALHHCVFWRPREDQAPAKGWYGSPPARRARRGAASEITHLSKKDRWGLFFERVSSCRYIERRTGPDLAARIREIAASWRKRKSSGEDALLLAAVPVDAPARAGGR